ncbi:hypothetical protein D3C86_1743850 [compost metagenome]
MFLFFNVFSGVNQFGNIIDKADHTVYLSIFVEPGLEHDVKIMIYRWLIFNVNQGDADFLALISYPCLVHLTHFFQNRMVPQLGYGLGQRFANQITMAKMLVVNRVNVFVNKPRPRKYCYPCRQIGK